MDVYERLKELNIELPPLPPKAGLYQRALQVGNFVYVSGQGSTINGVPAVVGHVGDDLTIEQGQEAARLCALNTLRVLHDYLGDLNKIKRLVKTLGWVSSAPGFGSQPTVVNGCSNLFRDIWGEEDGVGVRSAIGTNQLPENIACEIEFMFELK